MIFDDDFVGNLGKGSSVGGGNGSFSDNKPSIHGSVEPRRKSSRNYYEPQFKQKVNI